MIQIFDIKTLLLNLQIAVESSSDRVERADFTGKMIPFRVFSRYGLILRGFVPDIDQKMVNLQNAVEPRLEGAERTDFTQMLGSGLSFPSCEHFLRGFALFLV